MPRLHEKILEALPGERLRVGAFQVDPSTREIGRDGVEPTRVSVKAIDVLLMLVAHEGKVVGRQALLDTIWPDTLPTEEVVTQAVAQLRKAFGDGKPAAYIETIAKHGYRLKAPVMWLPQPAPTVAANDETRPGGDIASLLHGRRAVIALVAVALGLLVGAALFLRAPQPTEPVVAPQVAQVQPQASLEFRKLTSRPGIERWSAPSPDGSLVAYVEYTPDQDGARLMLQSIAAAQPTALTEMAPGKADTMPTWSADGREIAFQRTGAGVCHFMVIAATGGEPRQVASCTDLSIAKFSWSPDGRHFATTGGTGSRSGSALRVVEVATGRILPLAYTRGDFDEDMAPTYSPDGRWIVFQRNVSRGDLWRMPATGGKPERLTQLETNFYGVSWMPDGNALVFARYALDKLHLSRLDLRTRQLTDLGLEDVAFPQVALRAPVTTFTTSSFRANLYRVRPGSAATDGTLPQRVFASTATEFMPSLSPDGKQLVFASDRSGDARLWWVELERPATLRPIEGFTPMLRHPPTWSADGRHLLAVGQDAGGERLAEIAMPQGQVRWLPRLKEGKPLQAIYLPGDGGIAAVVDRGSGTLAAFHYDTRATPWRPITHLDDVSVIRLDPAAPRLVMARNTQLGIWTATPGLQAPRLLDPLYDKGQGRSHALVPERGFHHQARRLVVWPSGVAMLGGDRTCELRWYRLPFRPQVPAPCLDRRVGSVLGASYDAARGDLYYAYETDHNDDIGWARLSP